MQLSPFSVLDGHRSAVMTQVHKTDRDYFHHHRMFQRVALERHSQKKKSGLASRYRVLLLNEATVKTDTS